jgi:hypothetical protein
MDPESSVPTILTTILFCFCFCFFFLFFFYFSCGTPLLSIFGNVHCTLKTAPPNIITNKEHHPPLFFLFYSLFYCYFSCGTASLSIFGNTYWTLKIAPPNIITNSEHHPPLFFPDFFPILLLFFIWHSLTFHIWKCTLDPENSTPKYHQQQ